MLPASAPACRTCGQPASDHHSRELLCPGRAGASYTPEIQPGPQAAALFDAIPFDVRPHIYGSWLEAVSGITNTQIQRVHALRQSGASAQTIADVALGRA